jgi:hypothetical protein
MKIRIASKLGRFAVGITIAVIAVAAFSWFKTGADCVTSKGQTVVKWKDQRWRCRHWWSLGCRRKHSTYKVTLHEGIPLRDEKGVPVVIASGKIRAWRVYDSTAWNGMRKGSWQRESYPGYEPIAQNEYVVMVQTRYRLFHNVEANLRICTEQP